MKDGIRIIVDGLTNRGRQVFMAYRKGFENLQESHGGFGPSPDHAYTDLQGIEAASRNASRAFEVQS